MVKPDAVALGLTGTIISRFEERGLTLLAVRLTVGTEAQFTAMYHDKQDYAFWDELLAFLTSGPVVPFALEGVDASARVRQIVGEKDPLDSLPGTIRGSFPALDKIRCLVHGSRTPEEAASELSIWFPDLFPGSVVPAAAQPEASAPYAPNELVLPDEIVSSRRLPPGLRERQQEEEEARLRQLIEPWRVPPGRRR